MVKIKEMSFLSTRGMGLMFGNCMHCIIPYIDTLNVQNSCLTGQNCNLAVIVASLSCNGRLVVVPGECKGMRAGAHAAMAGLDNRMPTWHS